MSTSSVQSVIRLTPTIRKKATANVWQRKEEAFDLPLLHDLIHKALSDTDSVNQETVFEKLRLIDLNLIVKESPGLNKFFTCSFFVKRYAWISQNDKGEYRYFSKIKDGYGYYALDLFDLIGILTNQTTRKSIEYIREKFAVEALSRWDEREKEKYEQNKYLVDSLQSNNYPHLKRMLRNGEGILKAFLSYGCEKVNGKHLSDGEHAIFFLSVSHFKARYFPDKSVSTLNQWMNLFAVLGLIDKTTNVPIELQTEAEKQQALKKKHNHISFYTVPHFEKVIEKAELRASDLVKNRISYHQLTKAVVLSIFGHAVHDHVYIQKTHGRKSKATKQEKEYEVERVETFFRTELMEKGMVAKRHLSDLSDLPRHTFNRLWTELIEQNGCQASTPTKEERIRYKLTHRQTVARKLVNDGSAFIWRHENKLPWDIFAPNQERVSIPA